MSNRITELLKALHEGGEVELAFRENQEGREITVDSLTFLAGRWYRHQLNCWSSRDYGFGTCNCVSHPAMRADRITRAEVLSHLQAKVREEVADATERQKEIEWLERAIQETAAI